MVSTVDQVGSRLLFRGYGVSDSMKPIHAALLGNDVLYLLDEVHLSEPFRQTLAAIGGRYANTCSGRVGEIRWAQYPLRSPFEVIEMSATPGRERDSAFRLAPDDERHPVLSKRLRATKKTTLASSNSRAFVGEIEKHVKSMASEVGATIAVVVNRVATAREVHARLSVALKDVEVFLVTGRMRPLDRDRLEKELFPRICSGRMRDPAQRPVVVVATQCIEAGADFDFDGLVTECASLDALRQRFGRLDRLGQCLAGARAVIVARGDTLDDDPVYGPALGATWRWLGTASAANGGEIDFGIRALVIPEGSNALGLLTPRPIAPILLPSHLDAWAQTSPRPTPDPDVALWLHGPERGLADVQLVWRADLSASLLQRAMEEEAQAASMARDVAIGLVQAVPPVSGEAMSVPFFAVKRWLEGRSESDVADVEGAREVTDDEERQNSDRAARSVVAWRGDASTVALAADIKPGDTIVVPASYGGISNGSWAPEATDPIVDVAELAIWTQRGRAVLRLHGDVIRGLFGNATPSVPVPASAVQSANLEDRLSAITWLEQLRTDDIERDARGLLEFLRAQTGKRGIRVCLLYTSPSPRD